MNDALRVIVPLLLALYLGVTFLWRSYAVWRQTDVNPYVLSRQDDAEGVIARAFQLTLVLLVVAVGFYTAGDRTYRLVAPLVWLEHPLWQGLGTLDAGCVARLDRDRADPDGQLLEDRYRRSRAHRPGSA